MTLPHNGNARFRLAVLEQDAAGDLVPTDETEWSKSFRACLSTPDNIDSDPSVDRLDLTREEANFRIDPPASLVDERDPLVRIYLGKVDDVLVEWTPDGGGVPAKVWNVDRIHQPVSVAGRVLSWRWSLSRVKQGLYA